MRAQLIDGATGRRRAIRDALTALLDGCRPLAAALGCTAELAAATALANDPGTPGNGGSPPATGQAALPAQTQRRVRSGDRHRRRRLTQER